MSYKEIRDKLVEQRGGGDFAGLKPCSFCGVQTPHATLAMLSRCRQCYELYVNAGKPSTRHAPTFQEREVIARGLRAIVNANRDPLGWIDRLRARQIAGEHMSSAQRAALERVSHIDRSCNGRG